MVQQYGVVNGVKTCLTVRLEPAEGRTRDNKMLFKTAQQYGVVNGVKSSRQTKEIQDRNLDGIRSCKNVIDNTGESCVCTVTSTVGRLKLMCEMVGRQIIHERQQDKFFWDL